MITRRTTNPAFTPRGDGLGIFAPQDVKQIFSRSDSAGWIDPTPESAASATPNPPPAAPLSDMSQQAAEQEIFFKDFSGRSLSDPTAAVYNLSAPWIEPPDGFQSFLPLAAIVTPAAGAGDTVIVSFRVPTGYDGIINKIANYFTGAGAFNNPGAILWRITINGQPARNFDSIQLFFGQFSANGGVIPMSFEGIQIRADDLVQLVVNNVSMPAPGTNVYGMLGGYFYPKET